MRKKKTNEEFNKFMWDLYPKDEDVEFRTAMLITRDFLSGKLDWEGEEKIKISTEIRLKLVKNGFKFDV